MCLTSCAIKCFPSILIWTIQLHLYFQSMFSGSLSNKIYLEIFSCMFHNVTVTVNLFEISDILSEMYLTCTIKCSPSLLIWPIQIYYCFKAMFSGNLSNNIKTEIYNVFSIMQLSLLSCLISFDMCNKVFSLNYMANPNVFLLF